MMHSTSISACATAYAAPSNDGYTLVTPVYAGMGASDPNGCLVRYVGSDVILSGNATGTTPSTWCTAGNSLGAFRAGPLSSQQVSKTPAPLSSNFQQYTNLLGSGITFWAVNPNALNNPMAFWKSLYPNTTTQASPGDELGRMDEGAFELFAGRLQWRARRHAVQR